MRPALPILASAAALVAGCAEDLTPGSVLEGTRVLAVVTAPYLEAGPGDVLAADALVYEAPGEPVLSREWSFCPLTTGSGDAYRCVLDACETPLPPSSTFEPYALAEACVAAAGGAPAGGGSEPLEVESVLRLRVRTASRTLESVLRLPVSTSAPAPEDRNRPPAITRVLVGGAPATGGSTSGSLAAAGGRIDIAAEIDPASIDSTVDGSGRTRAESVVVSFYTTAGRFTEDRGEAPRAETVLEAEELPADAVEATVWIVARDLRGGQAWDGPFRIAIER